MKSEVWDQPSLVAGFAAGQPNPVLMNWVRQKSQGRPMTILDIGCGAGRNAIPLAREGHSVLGLDQSEKMLEAAQNRSVQEGLESRCLFQKATMDKLPIPDRCADLVIAHGIWNLATSDSELHNAVKEASRAAKPGAGLFVFTFSRDTLAADLKPIAGEHYVYNQFSGSPQVFLTEVELNRLLAEFHFERENKLPLTKYNDRGTLLTGSTAPRPVIWEGTWIRT